MKPKVALYRETLRTTGFYVGRVVIVSKEFAPISSACSLTLTILGALRMRFLRHRGIYRSDSDPLENQTGAGALPPAGSSHPSSRTRREEHALPIVPMSSGRLFLDRVARQHCPSPLHRHPQISMHFSEAIPKEDISTLHGGGHFYFALTPAGPRLRTEHIR